MRDHVPSVEVLTNNNQKEGIMAVMLGVTNKSGKVVKFWCGCCGPLTKSACRREVVKARRAVRHAVRHAEKSQWKRDSHNY